MTTAEIRAEQLNARVQGINATTRYQEEHREGMEFNGRLKLAREITFHLTGGLKKLDVGWVMTRLFGGTVVGGGR
jgi:hypothetical protein